MEIELGQIMNSFNALNELASKELPAKVSFRISKMLKEVQENAKYFEETKQKILENNNAEFDDANNRWIIPDEAQETVNNELQELTREKVTLNSYKPVYLKDLDNTSISVSTMLTLDWLIRDEEDEE